MSMDPQEITASWNLNEYVHFKLGKGGEEILLTRYDKLRKVFPKLPATTLPPCDDQGWYKMQGHDFIHVFGPHLTIGLDPPIETTIRIDSCKPLSTPQRPEPTELELMRKAFEMYVRASLTHEHALQEELAACKRERDAVILHTKALGCELSAEYLPAPPTK